MNMPTNPQTSRLASLRQKVKDMYEAKDSNRGDWADWLYEHHVFVVADRAKELAERFGADAELAQAAAMLHDVADTKMSRFEPNHEEASLQIARESLEAAGYTAEEIQLVVDDAIKLHRCRDGRLPQSKVGLVMATADALAHLTTDFYIRATQMHGHEGKSMEEIKSWVLTKSKRDFTEKIRFDEVREEARPSYEMIKTLYSRSSH